MPNHGASLDRLFQSLADPTRRAVLERLSAGPAATSELARGFDMALPSFLQHLQMLEACALVRSRKQGRVRTWTLSPRPLETAERWMSDRRATWEQRLHQLDRHLYRLKRKPT